MKKDTTFIILICLVLIVSLVSPVRLFVLDLLSKAPAKVAQIPQPAPGTPQVTSGCVVSGCNNELCSAQPSNSVCQVKPENKCYATAHCELQSTGDCGWTMTPALQECLQKATQDQTPN